MIILSFETAEKHCRKRKLCYTIRLLLSKSESYSLPFPDKDNIFCFLTAVIEFLNHRSCKKEFQFLQCSSFSCSIKFSFPSDVCPCVYLS